MTADPKTHLSPRLVLYRLAFRVLRSAWSLGDNAARAAHRPQRQRAPDLSGPAARRLELEPAQGSPPRPEGS